MIQPIVSSMRPITLIGGADPAPGVLSDALIWGDSVVCADGGANLALIRQLSPIAVIGDLDSISDQARRAFADILHNFAEQDSTDFDKALRHIASPVVLAVGFRAGRLDHELAALNTLVRHPDRRCILLGEDSIAMLCPPEITLNLPVGCPVSLYPMGDVGCESVGLRWDTAGIRFAPDGRVGTSNEAMGAVSLRPDAPKMLLILPRMALDITVPTLLHSDAKWPAPGKVVGNALNCGGG